MAVFKIGRIYHYEFLVDGQRYRKSTGMKNKRDAERLEKIAHADALKQKMINELLGESTSHPNIPPKIKPQEKTITLQEGLRRIEKERYAYNKAGDRSIQNLQRCIDIIGRKKRFDEVTHNDLVEIKRVLKQDGLAPGTINRYLAAIKTLLNDARKEWGIVSMTPDIRKLKEPKNPFQYLTEAEEDQIIREWPEGKYKRLFIILLDTGMRISECLESVKLQNIDEQDGTLTVPGERSKSGVGRIIPLTERAMKAFKQQIEEEGDLKWNTGQNSASKIMSKLLPRNVTAHGLRHTFCLRLIEQGANLYRIQQLMGHSTIMMTERYSHVSIKSLKEDIKKHSDAINQRAKDQSELQSEPKETGNILKLVPQKRTIRRRPLSRKK